MRLLNLLIVAALIMAAAYVYDIKFESTLQASRVAKFRSDIRRERDVIAALRAEWTKLDNPARLQGLARRHTTLRPMEARQFDGLDGLPERAPVIVKPPQDQVSTERDSLDMDMATGSISSASPQAENAR